LSRSESLLARRVNSAAFILSLRTEAEIRLESLRQNRTCTGQRGRSVEGEMLDLAMMARVAAAFAGAAAYVGICYRLGLRPHMPDEDHQ
jgi:hypothetical protein